MSIPPTTGKGTMFSHTGWPPSISIIIPLNLGWSTIWVTNCHPPHWVWVSYQGAWLAPGMWPLLCLLMGYVTGSQVCPVSATQCLCQPNPFHLGATEAQMCGWDA